MSLSLISTPIREPISLTFCLGLNLFLSTVVFHPESIRFDSLLMFISPSRQLNMLLFDQICNLLVFRIKLSCLMIGFFYGYNNRLIFLGIIL